MIRYDELLEYMQSQMTHAQLKNKDIQELMPVITKAIIKAVQSATK
jgi:hypothetical protein